MGKLSTNLTEDQKQEKRRAVLIERVAIMASMGLTKVRGAVRGKEYYE